MIFQRTKFWSKIGYVQAEMSSKNHLKNMTNIWKRTVALQITHRRVFYYNYSYAKLVRKLRIVTINNNLQYIEHLAGLPN